MRHFIVAILFGCTLCGATQAENRQPGRVALQDFTGQFILNDGRVLTVVQRQRMLAAQVDGRDMVLLKATGPATFATTHDELVLTFDQRGNGNVAGVTVAERNGKMYQASR
jgi:hypothetical protein